MRLRHSRARSDGGRRRTRRIRRPAEQREVVAVAEHVAPPDQVHKERRDGDARPARPTPHQLSSEPGAVFVWLDHDPSLVSALLSLVEVLLQKRIDRAIRRRPGRAHHAAQSPRRPAPASASCLRRSRRTATRQPAVLRPCQPWQEPALPPITSRQPPPMATDDGHRRRPQPRRVAAGLQLSRSWSY